MKRGGYIVGRGYDWAFFLGPPVLALVVGILLSDTPWTSELRWLADEEDTLAGFFLGTLVHAHLVAVVFRSHGNTDIRRRYPIRFFAVPILLWAGIFCSPWIAVAATVVATFWDVWHSGAQTFGLARIYERNRGIAPHVGRRLDFWLNQLLYAGPILAGATLMDHVGSFDSFAEVGNAFFTSVPAAARGHRAWLTFGVLGAAAAFLVVYVVVHLRLARAGWRPSWQKVWLVTSTGFVSIYSWGWNTWGEAFLIMNLFHGIQYLALVWAMEGRRISAQLRLPHRPRVVLLLYLATVGAYGLGVQALDPSFRTLWAVTMVVSLMHFWYDAFIWSVRRAEV